VEKEDREIIRHISVTLDEVLAVLNKPESKFFKIMEIVGDAVGIIGILAVVDILRNWIIGG
jgi:hypothetical protein